MPVAMPSEAMAVVRLSGGTARLTAPTRADTPEPPDPSPSSTPATSNPVPVAACVMRKKPAIEHRMPIAAVRPAPNLSDQNPNTIAANPQTRFAAAIALENGSRPISRSIVTGRKYKPSTWRKLIARPVIRQAAATTTQTGRDLTTFIRFRSPRAWAALDDWRCGGKIWAYERN